MKSQKNHYYVYAILDPRKPGNYNYPNNNVTFNHEPFYIGKGSADRMYWHLEEAKIHGSNRHRKCAKIIKIWKNGLEPILIKIKENLLDEDAYKLEENVITEIGRIDCDNGPLTNMNWGGTGNRGLVHSEESKSKTSDSLKDAYESGRRVHAFLGKNHSEKSKQKCSNTLKTAFAEGIYVPFFKGKKLTEEHKQKCSDSLKIVAKQRFWKHYKIYFPNGEEEVVFGSLEVIVQHIQSKGYKDFTNRKVISKVIKRGTPIKLGPNAGFNFEILV